MGGPQSPHGLPALWSQDPGQQQRTCMFYLLLLNIVFNIKYLFLSSWWRLDRRSWGRSCSLLWWSRRSTANLWGERWDISQQKELEITASSCYLERPGHRPDHRQNEELRSEEHPGLQRRGGPLPGGRGEHRDGVSCGGGGRCGI